MPNKLKVVPDDAVYLTIPVEIQHVATLTYYLLTFLLLVVIF